MQKTAHLSQLFIFVFILISILGCQKHVNFPAEIESNFQAKPEYYQLDMEIEGEIPTEYKVDMTLFEIIDDVTIVHPARIERRGGFSISFPKHSYEIDLDEDIPLGNLPDDDDWILNANYIDKTFLRHVMSYQIFRDMHPNNRAPQTKYVELSRNHEYYGLFVLMEKVDRSVLEVDKNDEMAVIFKESPIFRPNIDQFIPQDSSNFHQQTFPKLEDDDKTEFINDLRAFIVETTDEVFTSEFTHHFDLANIIDWHLLILLTNNNDGILKNFYLYKTDSQTPVRIAPWDYDHSFGRGGAGHLNLIAVQCNPERSILFKRLMEFDWYKTALKNRWGNLQSSNLFTARDIRRRIREYRVTLDMLVERNFEKWPVDGPRYMDDANFVEEIEIMHTYLDMRFEQLEEYFEGF